MLSYFFEKVMFLSLAGAAAVALFMLICGIFGKGMSEGVKYRLLLIPLLLFIVPVNVSLPQGEPQEESYIAVTAEEGAEVTDVAVNEITQNTAAAPSAGKAYAKLTEEKVTESEKIKFKPFIDAAKAALPMIWLVGAGILLLAKLLSAIKFRAGLKKIECASEGDVRYFDGECTPFVTGIIKPKIYMPLNLTEDEKRIVLLHERTHIRRGDLILKFAAEILCAVHFFNPFVYLLRHLLNNLTETSCDEAVCGKMEKEERREYGRMILTVVKKERIPSAACLAEKKENMERRIEVIMKSKKRNLGAKIMSAVAAAALILGSTAAAAAIAAQSDAAVPKAVYVAENVNNIRMAGGGELENHIVEGGTAIYSDFLGKSRFELSFYAMNEETENEIDRLLDEGKSEEAWAYYDDLENFSQFYEVELTEVTRRYGEWHYIEGLFTATKNGEVLFENEKGYLEALPPDAPFDTPHLTILNGDEILLSAYFTLEELDSYAAEAKRAEEKEFTLSRETRVVRLGKYVEGEFDGEALNLEYMNQGVDNWKEGEEWNNYLGEVKYNPALDEAEAYFSLGEERYIRITMRDEAVCMEGSMKGEFYICEYIGGSIIVTDVLTVRIENLNGEAGEYVVVESGDGRIYLKQEIVPYVEEPLNVHGTRSPEEFYAEGEEVFIGTPKEQDEFDLDNPDKIVERIIVDENRKVLAVVTVANQTGFLEEEEGKKYRKAATWSELFTNPAAYVVYPADGSGSEATLVRYDMASWWIKAIIPPEWQFYEEGAAVNPLDMIG